MTLRYKSAAVAEQLYDPSTFDAKSIIPFIKWLENHLSGIPFADVYDPIISGDYDPKRPSFFLDGMHKTYHLNGDLESAELIKKSIESPNLMPSEALKILHDRWDFYSKFPTMNKCLEYCILCAEKFPDAPESRREFKRAVKQIHLTLV